jgi:hypothetical protein
MGKPQQIRDHIAYFLQEAVKAYAIDGVCDRLGMPVVEGAWTYNSKRVYVQNRLAGVPASELLQIAQRVVEEFDDPELEQLLEGGGFRGVDGKLKNIIFAADGPKPRSHSDQPPRGTRSVGGQRGLDRGRRHRLAQRCLDGCMDVLGPHRLAVVGQDVDDGFEHPPRPAWPLPACYGPSLRPALARTAANFLARRASDPWRSWFE